MKRLASILSICLALACLSARAADLVVSNNAIITIFGDSLMVDDQAPSVGYRFPDYLESYFQLNYPGSNIHVFNLSRSGGTMADRLTNNIQKNGLALWGYQANNFQKIGISSGTDNGALTGNQMYLAQSNVFQAPAIMSDGDATLNVQSGQAAAIHVQWIGLGELPEGSDGSSFEQSLNNGSTNAGWTLGIRGIDWWYAVATGWTNDFNSTGGLKVGYQKGGHPGGGGELSLTMAFIKQITTDTNISTATVDWNSSTPVATNHCVISGISKSGTALTFTRHDDRLPFAWDFNPLMGITNDCSQAFILNPADAEAFKFTITVTNLPAGTYAVMIDGVLCSVLSDTALAAGWNMFTNMSAGPYAAQRREVLGRIRDKEHVDRLTRLPGSAGDQVGMVSYESNAGAFWGSPSFLRGDTLIAALASKVANVMSLDALTAAAAVPTNHTFTILPMAPTAIVSVSAVTNAFKVSAILDGSHSLKATNYYWLQTNGTPQLDIIGQFSAKPMIISVTNAGDYTFQLIVTDGSTYGTNAVTVTFVQPTGGHTNYIDSTLSANITGGTYSIPSRNSSGSDGNAFTNFAAAIANSHPGDLFLARAGIFSNSPSAGNQILANVTNSGTVTAPIRFETYNGEHVALVGWGFSDADANSDGMADGPNFPLWRQTLIFIEPGADYIQVKGFDLTNSQQSAMTVEGRFCSIEECVAHDNWTVGIGLQLAKVGTNTMKGTVARWCEAYQNRHFDGMFMGLEDQSTFGFMSDCAIVECLSYHNGYTPAGSEVLPIGGDAQGGGNSDGFGATKFFADNGNNFPQYGVKNWGINLYFVRSIAWNNCDDGFDFSCANSRAEDNRSAFNGPTGTMGFKVFRPTFGLYYCGNIAFGNQGRGWDGRIDTNASFTAINNTAIRNAAQGFVFAANDSTSQTITTGNVGAFDGAADFPNGQPFNWGADGNNVGTAYRGDPLLISTNLTLPTSGLTGTTVRARWANQEALWEASLSPATNSPLLRASIFIPGYHVATADNDAVNPAAVTALGRHWFTPAPDLGARNALSTNIVQALPPTTIIMGVRK